MDAFARYIVAFLILLPLGLVAKAEQNDLNLDAVIAHLLAGAGVGSELDLENFEEIPQEFSEYFTAPNLIDNPSDFYMNYSVLDDFAYDPESGIFAFTFGDVHNFLWDSYQNLDKAIYVFKWNKDKSTVDFLKKIEFGQSGDTIQSIDRNSLRLFGDEWLQFSIQKIGFANGSTTPTTINGEKEGTQLLNLKTGEKIFLSQNTSIVVEGYTLIRYMGHGLYIASSFDPNRAKFFTFDPKEGVKFVSDELNELQLKFLLGSDIIEVLYQPDGEIEGLKFDYMHSVLERHSVLHFSPHSSLSSSGLISLEAYQSLANIEGFSTSYTEPVQILHQLGQGKVSGERLIQMSRNRSHGNFEEIDRLEAYYDEDRISPAAAEDAYHIVSELFPELVDEMDFDELIEKAQQIEDEREIAATLSEAQGEVTNVMGWTSENEVVAFELPKLAGMSSEHSERVSVPGPQHRWEIFEEGGEKVVLIDTYTGQLRTFDKDSFNLKGERPIKLICTFLLSKDK